MLRRAMILITAGLVLSACSRRQEPPPAQPTQTTQPTQQPTQPARDTAAERMAREEAARREAAARARATLEERVFFDFDDSRIRSDQQGVLDRKVAVLRSNPNVALRIVGHADERGSLEYNLALGLRRANSVRDYLSGFNLEASRFAVDSMGEDQPLDPGHTEAAWSRNRRAEFVITRGGENLMPPGGQ